MRMVTEVPIIIENIVVHWEQREGKPPKRTAKVDYLLNGHSQNVIFDLKDSQTWSEVEKAAQDAIAKAVAKE